MIGETGRKNQTTSESQDGTLPTLACEEYAGSTPKQIPLPHV